MIIFWQNHLFPRGALASIWQRQRDVEVVFFLIPGRERKTFSRIIIDKHGTFSTCCHQRTCERQEATKEQITRNSANVPWCTSYQMNPELWHWPGVCVRGSSPRPRWSLKILKHLETLFQNFSTSSLPYIYIRISVCVWFPLVSHQGMTTWDAELLASPVVAGLAADPAAGRSCARRADTLRWAAPWRPKRIRSGMIRSSHGKRSSPSLVQKFGRNLESQPTFLPWEIPDGMNATDSNAKAWLRSFRYHSGAFEIFQCTLL